MRKTILATAALAAMPLLGAPGLFSTATESKWEVKKGTAVVGTVTLLTSTSGTRADWRAPKSSTITFLGGKGAVYVRSTGGDVDVATYSGDIEKPIAPALLLPFTTKPADKVESKDGKPSTYAFGSSKAVYRYDAKGPSAIDVTVGSLLYKLTRTSLSTSNAGKDTFEIRPKKGAAIAMAGDLLGPSDAKVSATLGSRGVDPQGVQIKNSGGNHAALVSIEERDQRWRDGLDAELRNFQKSGKVGKEREE